MCPSRSAVGQAAPLVAQAQRPSRVNAAAATQRLVRTRDTQGVRRAACTNSSHEDALAGPLFELGGYGTRAKSQRIFAAQASLKWSITRRRAIPPMGIYHPVAECPNLSLSETKVARAQLQV